VRAAERNAQAGRYAAKVAGQKKHQSKSKQYGQHAHGSDPLGDVFQ